MDDALSHLPELLRVAARRLPRRDRKSDRGEGGTPCLPQNNYLADAPEKPVGARPGNCNALKHGRFTADKRARRAALTALVRDMRRRLAEAVAMAEEDVRRREQRNG